MKLKINKLAIPKKEEKPKEKKKSKLPPDTYKNVLDSEPKELELDEEQKLVFSVARKGDDGLPHVDVRLYLDTEIYTGPTKKGINFDSDLLLDVIDYLEELRVELEAKGF